MVSEAQRRAHQAHLGKLKQSGWVRLSLFLSPEAQAKLEAIMQSRGLSKRAAVEAALLGFDAED